jgi:hypothetical protein
MDTAPARFLLFFFARFRGGLSPHTSLPPPPLPHHQALSAEEAAALAATASTATAAGASAWNAAGTWEDRDVTAAAKAALTARLAGLPVGGATSATITAVEAITGDASVSIVRGQRRAGFDFDVTLRWQHAPASGREGAPAAAPSTGGGGTARVPNLASDELDDLRVEEVVVDGEGGDPPPPGLAASLARAVADAVAGLAAEMVA